MVRKGYLLLLSLGLWCIQISELAAHAVVTDYSLNIQQIRAHRPDKVVLTFNSQVELGLSQLFLVSKGDKQSALPMYAGEKQGQVVVKLPGLNVGHYAIKFKVFAADGHLTEDVIHFSVRP